MKLPGNFEMEKYGLHVRLVNENDAEFIVNLRNDIRARFMNTVTSDVENQKKWIKEYKEREADGLDYYFIYYLKGQPLGVNRIYNIKNDSFVGGSLIFKRDCDFEIPILATLIQYFIGFEVLDKSICFGNIRKNNKIALRFNKLLGNDFIYDYGDEEFIVLSKKIYFEVKQRYEVLLLS
jgi:hypothetical protein